MTTTYLTCPLCEATCGLEVTHTGARIDSVRGDDKDVFSAGFICPKGASLGALHDDPDRLRSPMVRRGDTWSAVGWDEAFGLIAERLPPLVAEHGADAVAVYVGNPSAHNLSALLYGRALYKALGTHNMYTATTVDQMPKHFTSGYLFGDPLSIPVPDVDRTDYLLMLGANPMVSNGSLMTAPNMRARLRAIRARGGRVVVIDPRRTRTAELADEHHAIRPGTDALLLFALVHVLFDEQLVDLGRLEPMVTGVEEVRELCEPFTPDAVAGHTGIGAGDIRRLARELAAAPSAAVYGRIGTTTQEFGTLASWLVDVLNVLTGNLDRPGGAMFPLAAAGQANSAPGPRKPFRHARWHSRVRGLPEVLGELPVSTLAEEIRTPGPGQIRALITISGNPCLSTPHASALDEALRSLDFMVSVDPYLNETTRHAHVVLPTPPALARDHYDLALYQFAVRNVANWTPAAVPSDLPQEWETLLRLAAAATGQGAATDVGQLDDLVAADVARRTGQDPAAVAGRRGPARLVDLMLRAGPYRLTLADLEAAPHGIDLGPLQPRLPELLSTPSGRVELAPAPVVADVPRLAARLDATAPTLVLIGRRQLNSNNSWMHNVPALVRGSNRCTAQVHPEDAAERGIADAQLVTVRSRTGAVTLPAELTETVRRGVVSIPHGWGHDADGASASVARQHAGVNSNVLADDLLVDAPTGTAVLNGIPVELSPAGADGRARS